MVLLLNIVGLNLPGDLVVYFDSYEAPLCRRGPRGERADIPREQRQPRGGDARLQRGGGVARHLPQGRGHRHRVVQAQRPQRGRRADVHAAPHVPEDQEDETW